MRAWLGNCSCQHRSAAGKRSTAGQDIFCPLSQAGSAPLSLVTPIGYLGSELSIWDAMSAAMATMIPTPNNIGAVRRPAAAQPAHPAALRSLMFSAAPLQQHTAGSLRAPRAAVQCFAAAATNGAAPSNGATNGASHPSRPTAAETARTIVDLAAHGTLCTLTDDGIPLGTYVSYVLDVEGQPILRLRADAVHTANLRRDPKCSLFVQPGEYPSRLLARVTLIGQVEPVSAEVAEKAAALHNTLHAGGVGVDEPQPSDLYYRLVVERCFYVGQLAAASAAEVLPGDDYRAAEPDSLRTVAVSLCRHWNGERLEDVMRLCCGAQGTTFEDMSYAELLWVDYLGVYVKTASQEGVVKTLRVPFMRPASDERDARSQLTMMAQVAWEREKPYQPVMVPPPEAANN